MTFEKIEYTIIPRVQNQFEDALATLTSMVEIPEGVRTQPLEIEQSYEEVHKRKTKALVMTIEEEVSWYYDIMKFLARGISKRCRQEKTSFHYVDGNTIHPMWWTTL